MPDEGSITLERGPCEGRCPTYTVRLYANGHTQWVGTSSVAEMGERVARVDAESVKQLWADLVALEVFERSCYEWHDPLRGCVMGWSTLTLDDGARQIEVSFGRHCPEGPDFALRDAMDSIDKLAKTRDWVGTRSERKPLGPPDLSHL